MKISEKIFLWGVSVTQKRNPKAITCQLLGIILFLLLLPVFYGLFIVASLLWPRNRFSVNLT